MGSHGTKIIIYNLWLNNDGDLELDFDSDPRVSIPVELQDFLPNICSKFR